MRRTMAHLVSFLLVMLVRPPSTAQTPKFIKVEGCHQAIDAQVLAITQDRQGFLWLGSQRGLFRYDGHSFLGFHHELSNPNSPAQDVIECLSADSAGFIWLAPQGMGLDRFDPTSGIFTHFRHDKNNPASLVSDSVTALFTDGAGTIWIGTNQGLDKLEQGSDKFVHYTHDPNDPSSLSFNVVRTIYEDKEGTIWVGTGSVLNQDNPRYKKAGGLNRLDKSTGKFTRYLHDEIDSNTLVDNRIRAIFEDSQGTFWVGSAGDGLHTMDRKTGKFKRHSFDPFHPDKLSRPKIKPALYWSEDHISFISEDHTGKILIGTFSAGINVYDKATQKVAWYGTDQNCSGKLQDELFWTAYKSRDNTLWICAWGENIYKIVSAPRPVTYAKTNRITISFTEDEKDDLWLGTVEGLFHQDKAGREKQFLIDPAQPHSPANLAFPIDKDKDSLLIATSFGLYYFDVSTNEYSRFLHHDPQDSNTVPSDSMPRVLKTSDGNLWIATHRGLAFWNAGSGRVKRFVNNPQHNTSISDNFVQWIELDSKGNLWVGSNGKLCRLLNETKHFKWYPILGIYHILEDRKGNLWAAGFDGLFKYDYEEDSFHKFIDEYGLMPPHLRVGWIMQDREGNLWLQTSEGVIQLRSDDMMRPVILGSNLGINGQVLTGGYVRKNGTLLFGDTSGYFEINPSILKERNDSHRVAITSFLLNNKPEFARSGNILSLLLLKTKEIILAHNQNTFSIGFEDIDFVNDQSIPTTIYQLEGYDNRWRQSNDKTGYYFNVPPGTYRFKVKSFDPKGNAAEESMIISIMLPWWKTWWSYTLLFGTVVTLGYFTYSNRIKYLKRRQMAQIGVMVATQEQERKRISRDLHDDIGTKLSALKMFISSLREKTSLRNDKETTALTASAEQFIQEVISDVRLLLHNLSPSVLEDFGYVTAVEGLVSKLNETKRVHFTLAVFGIDNRLHKDYELALYRITQELINNVLKHAGAVTVSLQIGCRDGHIILIIEDDGKGFDVTAKRAGYGLQNLQVRTKLMNGSMTIDSNPSKGTSVLIKIPYAMKT